MSEVIKEIVEIKIKKSVVIKPVLVLVDNDKNPMTLSDAMKKIGYIYNLDDMEGWHKPWRSARASLKKLTDENPILKVIGKDDKEHTFRNA